MATTATANPSFVPQSPSHWVPDEKRSSCRSCHKDFTFFNRRHHCRSCRDVFCGDCSDFRLLTRDPKDPTVVISVRACRPCFDKFRGRKMRGAKANSGMAAASPAMTKVRRNSRAEQDQSQSQSQPQWQRQREAVEMQPADLDMTQGSATGAGGAVPGSDDILHIPSDALASVRSSTLHLEQHHQYEGEDADITGTETIRVEEDEDHYVYPEGQHGEQGHTVKLFTVLSADGQHVPVDRDVVMAEQGSVVLPSKSAVGGMQFVNVDKSAARSSAVTGQPAANTPGLPSDTAAVFQESHKTARTPMNAAYQSADKDSLASGAAAGGEKDEFDRSADGAVEGSEDILHIPSDALASVKNSILAARQQQAGKRDEGELAWSERNVESHFAAQSPTTALPALFDEGSSGGEQQSAQKSSNIVV